MGTQNNNNVTSLNDANDVKSLPEEDVSVLYKFASETSAHGVGKIAQSQSTIKRVCWTVALLIAVAAATGLVAMRFITYYEYNTFTQIDKSAKNKLIYPAITFCNFNRLRASYVTSENALEVDLLISMLSGDSNSSQCAECRDDFVPCANDKITCCIPESYICDDYKDCSDNSDEINCTAHRFEDLFDVQPNPAAPADICSNFPVSGTTGWITSSNYSLDFYSSNTECRIDIEYQPNKYLLIDLWADIEESNSCIYDYLSIFKPKLCGVVELKLAYNMSAVGTVDVPITFYSDANINRIGFALKWAFSDDANGYTLVPLVNLLTFDSSTLPADTLQIELCDNNTDYVILNGGNATGLLLTTPGLTDGVNYPLNVNCSLIIKFARFTPTVEVLILDLESANAGICYDYLTFVYWSDGVKYREYFCGPVVNLTYSIDPNSTVTVSFYSDRSTTMEGAAIYMGDGSSLSRRKRSVHSDFLLHVRKTRGAEGDSTKASNETVVTEQNKADMTLTRFSALIRDAGWQLIDSGDEFNKTLLSCTFRGVTCNSSWFSHVFTKYGNCYTFNRDIDDFVLMGKLDRPLEQIQPGPNHGLSITLDVQSDEYSEDIRFGNPQVGLKFQVHSADEAPDVENKGRAVAIGMHAFAGFTLTKVKNMIPPWGECDPTRRLEYSNNYSYTGCAVECKLREVVKECECKPYWYPGEIVECTVSELRSCALVKIAELDRGGFKDVCNCPVACEYNKIDMDVSYAAFGTYDSRRTAMNKKFYGIDDSNRDPRNDSNFYKNNIISMNVYYSELIQTEMKQLQAMEFSSLMSDLGGQLGLFVGVSVLTVCEILEALSLGISKLLTRRMARKVGNNWVERTKSNKLKRIVQQTLNASRLNEKPPILEDC